MVASGAATKGVTVMKQTPPAAVGRRHLLEISASAAGVIALSACSGSPPEPGKGRPDTTPEQEVPVTAPEDLMREHGVLKRILLIYREGIRRLQADDQSPAPALNESAQIIRRFIEDYHGQLEEQYVFPSWNKPASSRTSPRSCAPSISAAGCSRTGYSPPPLQRLHSISLRETPWPKTWQRTSECLSRMRRARTRSFSRRCAT